MAKSKNNYKVRNKNFEPLRVEYINGNITLKDLAAKHGVGYNAVLQAAFRAKWTEQKSELIKKVIQDTYERQVKKRSDEIIKLNDNCVKVSNNLIGLAQKLLLVEFEKNIPNHRVLNSIARTVKEAQHIGRLALGISTDNIEQHIIDKKDTIVIEPNIEPVEAAKLYIEMIEQDGK